MKKVGTTEMKFIASDSTGNVLKINLDKSSFFDHYTNLYFKDVF